MNNETQFDHYLSDDGPAALVIREHLIPVEGPDGVTFPPTFASGDGFPGGYNIDGPLDGKNVCLIDSVGSQSNRIEPIFKEEKYKHLVPQVAVKAGEKEVNILDAGHRAGDAIVRCTKKLEATITEAFKALLRGDAEPLARLAPTSLVFGVWDSRNTQVKSPRLVASTIRAFNVKKLTRHAQYIPPVDYVDLGLLEEPNDLRDAEGKINGKHPFAQRGFTHQPVTKEESTRGGVIADGIRRDATLSLAALKLLATKDKEKTLALRRYILGLALTAFTSQQTCYLRQGCLLVLDPEKPREFVEVLPSGVRTPATLTHQQALDYATATAKAFGICEPQVFVFDPELTTKDVEKAKKTKKSK